MTSQAGQPAVVAVGDFREIHGIAEIRCMIVVVVHPLITSRSRCYPLKLELVHAPVKQPSGNAQAQQQRQIDAPLAESLVQDVAFTSWGSPDGFFDVPVGTQFLLNSETQHDFRL